jgi:hypothetical protein
MTVRHSQVQAAILLAVVLGAFAPTDAKPESGVRVIVPDEPPRLTPAAAQALLRVLLKARSQARAPARADARKD